MGKFIDLTITVPDVMKTFGDYSKPATKAANARIIRNINDKFGALCEKWGDVFEIEKGVLIAFIATESMGNPNAKSFVITPKGDPCCYGLMQASPEAVFESANKFKIVTGVTLPSEAAAGLSKVPNLLQKNAYGTLSDSTRKATIVKLLEPEFNIMSGTMILRFLLERFSTILTGAQLNKAIIGYNAGAYQRSISNPSGSAKKIPIDTATFVNMKTVPKESRDYLVKMLGVDGFMSLIYKDKVI